MSGIIDSLLPSVDSVLGVRDSIGAVKQPVFLVTRTWSGLNAQEGEAVDAEVQLLPSPLVKSYSQDVRLKEGGAIKSGDLILRNVSRNSYTEADLDGSSSAANIEKFYRVGDKIYQVINVTQSYLTFSVQVRELTNQARFI